MAPPPALCPPCAPDAPPTARAATPRQDFAPGARSWAFLAEPASGVMGGVLCPPSPAVQQRFPGIAAVWTDPSRRQRLIDGLRERLSTVATSVRRTEAEAHPAAAEGDGDRSSSAACGLFADAAIRRGELVGWYWGELVLADEVMRLPDRQQGRYAATFFVDDDLQTPALLPSELEPEPEPEPLGPARVTIDASRLRGPLAFANDFRWDALHQRRDPPPDSWPRTPNVEFQQMAVRLHDSAPSQLVLAEGLPVTPTTQPNPLLVLTGYFGWVLLRTTRPERWRRRSSQRSGSKPRPR